MWLCLDHDPAGIEASEKYYDLLSERHPMRQSHPQTKGLNEDIKAAHGLEALPAEPHPQHLLRDEICGEVSRLELNSDSSADALSTMLTRIRDHLHWGRFTEATDSLKDKRCAVPRLLPPRSI